MKIAIIGGGGRAGSQIAFVLAHSDLAIDELLLEDINEAVKGEAMDLQQSLTQADRRIRIGHSNELADCGDADIIVIASGIPIIAGMPERDNAIKQNAQIISGIMSGLNVPKEKKPIFIVLTNPVEQMTQIAGSFVLDRTRVFGISTAVDTARLNSFASGYIIGEGGGVMLTTSGPVELLERVKKIEADTMRLKGGAWLTISMVVYNIIAAIINDTKEAFPLAVFLQGEYGISNVCLSVPCVLGRAGITEVREVHLLPDQKFVLETAARSVQEEMNKLRQTE